MRWSEITTKPTERKLREFAAASAVVGVVLAVWHVASGQFVVAAALSGVALLAAAVGFWKPRWLAPVFTAAMIVTFPLAFVVSFAVLALIYYGLLTPLALLFRLFGRDALNRRPLPSQESYWQEKPAADNPRRYLRQY